jgi:hypothetical protein
MTIYHREAELHITSVLSILSNFKISHVRVAHAQLLYDYCVTIKNELPTTFASLGSEVAK